MKIPGKPVGDSAVPDRLGQWAYIGRSILAGRRQRRGASTVSPVGDVAVASGRYVTGFM